VNDEEDNDENPGLSSSVNINIRSSASSEIQNRSSIRESSDSTFISPEIDGFQFEEVEIKESTTLSFLFFLFLSFSLSFFLSLSFILFSLLFLTSVHFCVWEFHFLRKTIRSLITQRYHSSSNSSY
jgi:hypothetical protein